MPSILVDSDTSISYRDSGKPQQDVYTTFVIIHGHTFHSNTFQHMHPLALSQGYRLICPDRRDYCESTKFNKDDQRVLAEGTEAERTSFLVARGVEMANFIDRLIDELLLPPPTTDRKRGGVSLVGWSTGNALSISTIASASSMSEKTLQRLQKYLRNLVILSPAHLALGLPGLPNVYTPIDDEAVPREDRGRLFVEWVSSYYTHGDLSTRDRAILNTQAPDDNPKSTVVRMSPEAFMSVVDFAPVQGSDQFLISVFAKPLFNQLHKAAFDPQGHAQSWPNLDLWFIYGDKEPWNVPYCAFEVEERSKAAGINVNFHVVSGTNHFMIWDDPEKTMDALAYTVQV